jgi:hypothetical protein
VISVVVPTIKGREEYLRECLSAYAATTDEYEVIVIEDKPACGPAWVEGAEKASGDYIHFSADDLRPHTGWFRAGIEVCDRGFLPAPRILNDDGTLQSCGGTDGWEAEAPTGEETDFSRIPFLSREQWDMVAPLVCDFLRDSHYYTDNAVSYAGRKAGFRTGVHRDYLFTHSLANPGRGAGMSWEDRMRADYQKLELWLSGL